MGVFHLPPAPRLGLYDPLRPPANTVSGVILCRCELFEYGDGNDDGGD